MRIAIVGSGISGLTCAHYLYKNHDIQIFESSDWIGGHTHTVDVEMDGQAHAIDTGFIVFNQLTYPNFLQLLSECGADYQDSSMSFGVLCERTGLEYNATSVDTLFAQRRNILKPSFWLILKDIYRFYKEADAALARGDTRSLGQYLSEEGYSASFIEQHIVPMAAAVWSAPPSQMMSFPLEYLLRFFHNHGFTKLAGRPQWHVIKGGSREYVRKLVKPFENRIHLKSPVRAVTRYKDHVELAVGGETHRFDEVIMACHSDTALKILTDASAEEIDILENIPYQKNEVTLHTDASLMPKAKKAWASWNYRVPKEKSDNATVTYWMNKLQGLEDAPEFFVSLNQGLDIDPEKIIKTFFYDHPVYTRETVIAQARHGEISGGNTHFCGAYWHYGFHEDGVKSALRVCQAIEEKKSSDSTQAA